MAATLPHPVVALPVDPSIDISVVVPLYGAAGCLVELAQRIRTTLDPLVGETAWELVLVDDCGPDESWSIAQDLAHDDPRITAARMSRNFGQEAATSAGFRIARGSWIVTMDCDLQDRPEDIATLYAARDGHAVVQGVRIKQGAAHRIWGTRLYFAVLNAVASTDINWQCAAYSMIAARVRDSYLALGDIHRNLLMVLDWLGYPTTYVEVAHDERAVGTSSYTLRKLVRYAFAGVFFHTTAPLRWVIQLGMLMSVFGMLAAGWIVAQRLMSTTYPGWASLMAGMLVMCGMIIVTVGVTGLYIGKVFEQTKHRPRFVIDEVVTSR